ncbi:PPC domain-containing protein [Fuerstiella marisgermanici]|uniref:Putative subtilase-type serine protease n=1 Tax=Fuerstiella marisgermanici TaxID=1891926 RepID=A0A1P8WF26_9PLAN|nr:PPC domain-containing protein [Fuerstiella marisgermanici]APZ92649.1 putative subtilase-type serine protease precursor [Fuerstiella marisgermanici]
MHLFSPFPAFRWIHSGSLLVIASLTLASPSSAAEQPTIDRFFPPGAQRGTSVDVKLTGKPGDGELKVWSDAGQLTFEFSEKKDSAKVTVPDDATPGIHWLRFYNETGASELRPFFVGVASEVAEVEPNNEVGAAQAIEQATAVVNGVLAKSGDVDTYSLNLKAGTTLVASMQANRDLGSPMDGVLRILGPNGAVVAHNDDDHGFDPQLAFEVPADGTYFVRTFAFPATPNSTIRLAGGATYVYRLTLTTEAFVDYTVPAMVDASATSEVALHGWNLPNNSPPLVVPIFQTRAVTLTGDFANVVQLSASGSPSIVEEAAQKEPLKLPVAVTGIISEPGQTDQYSFEGKKGQKLTIAVASRALHSPLDPVLSIKDAKGSELKQVDDRSREDLDAEASVTLKTDGTHTITVTDRFSHGGSRFFYVLTCAETKPGFTAKAKATAFTFADDKPVEIPIDVARQNGLSEEIEFTAEGLPDGVTAEPAVSTKDGDAAKKVTLKLVRASEAKAFSGTFRIVGRSKDSKIETSVVAPVAKLTAEAEHLWLTVPKGPEPKEPEPAEAEPAAEESKTP